MMKASRAAVKAGACPRAARLGRREAWQRHKDRVAGRVCVVCSGAPSSTFGEGNAAPRSSGPAPSLIEKVLAPGLVGAPQIANDLPIHVKVVCLRTSKQPHSRPFG